MKLNILGMDNCFEAARLAGVQRVVFASSLAVNGMQKHYGDRMITEDDYRHGEVQYAMHKIFNEWQAQDYNEKYGMMITARPAGERDRTGQGARLGGPREHHHPAGAGQADLVPVSGRDALPDPCRRYR